MIVVDASVAVAWFLEAGPAHSPALRYVEESGGLVPGNFHSEVVQGFLRAERQGRMDPVDATRAVQSVADLSLLVEPVDPNRVMLLAREHRLTAYEATYLTLAEHRSLPLATADAMLEKAAASINLLWKPRNGMG